MKLLFAIALIAAPASAETIFVSDEASDCVTAVDGGTLKPIECIHVGKRPRGLVASKDGKTLYVAVGNANQIAIVDTVARKIVRTLSTPDPETFALTPDETSHLHRQRERQRDVRNPHRRRKGAASGRDWRRARRDCRQP